MFLCVLVDRVTTAALKFLGPILFLIFISISYFNCVLMSSTAGAYLKHFFVHVSSTDGNFSCSRCNSHVTIHFSSPSSPFFICSLFPHHLMCNAQIKTTKLTNQTYLIKHEPTQRKISRKMLENMLAIVIQILIQMQKGAKR